MTEQKVALVTGASRGIGRAIARRLARDGVLVAVHYGSNEAAAKETLDLIQQDGGDGFVINTQLGVPGDADALWAAFDAGMAAAGRAPELDIVVNNVAFGPPLDLAGTSGDLFDHVFAVNVKAPFFIIQQGLSRLRDGGRIVNISSAVTRVAAPHLMTYSLSKGALNQFTHTLAKALGQRGITVNTVAPGFTETEALAARFTTPEQRAPLAALSVFNRIGQPADIADIVGFLASDDGRWVTGQFIDAAGGAGL